MTNSISYTKLVMSIGMIVFVGALVVGGTGAFFNDTETSTGNVFAAGAIDLLIDNTSYGFDYNDPTINEPVGDWGLNEANSWNLSDLDGELFFNFGDLKPGDYGEDTISIHVNDNDAWACMALNLTGTPENGQNEPEALVDDTDGVNEGELQNYLSFLFWYDDGDNVLEDGEQLIDGLNGLSGDIFDGGWLPIAESGADPLPGAQTVHVGKGWCFGDIQETPLDRGDDNTPPEPGATGFTCSGAGDHNDAQTDGIIVDVSFYAEQSRNNDQFLCSDLDPLVAEEGRPVGAVLAEYVAPDPGADECDATVSGSESIQTALTAAVADGVVCVADDYNGTGDDAALRMETNGVTLAALTQGTALDVPVVLSADGVTVTGFTGAIGQAESPSEVAAFYLDGDATNATISYNEVVGAGSGAAVLNESGADNSGTVITHNLFSNATQGIYLNSHTGLITIEYNDIDDHAAGIGNLNGALVQFNEFEATSPSVEAIGAGVDGFGDYDGSTIQFNNFLDGTLINAYTGGSLITVDAPNNYFDPSGGAVQAPTNVDFTPEALVPFPHN